MSAFGYTRYGQAFGVASRDAGARISDKLMTAVDRLAVDLHELFLVRAGAGGAVPAGLDDEFIFLYPFVGGTQVSHSINLADPSLNRIQFEDDTTVTHNANGITGPGNVQLFPFEGTAAADAYCAYGVYHRSSTIANNYQMACDMGGTASIYAINCKRTLDSNAVYYLGTRDANGWMVISVANAQGFYSAMRINSTASFAYKNGTLIGSSATAGGAGSSATFYLLGGGTYNLAFAYLTRSVSKVGYLSSAQHGTLYSIVQKFQTWCGRAV